MKKWVKGTLSIAGGVVLLACAGGYYMYKNYFPKEPERIVYDKEKCYNRYIISLKELI